ncbi:MAG TPA: ABC transporter permease [Pyrinomonadaceae bacterium]|nr:ABC transporter permease [Pyrinomonadaceae bacterium]
METLINDLRHGLRSLTKRKGFTAIALVTLALGIGANTAIFSIVNAVLLRPLPFKDPDQLVAVWERRENSGRANLPVSGHEFAAFRDRTTSFDALTLVQPDALALTGRGDATTVTVTHVSTDYFRVLGVPPLLGRTLISGEDDAGGAKVAVLSQKLWNQRFGSDPNIVNQKIVLNDEPYTVVGVMPALELMADVILPIDLRGEILKVGKHSHQVLGRLKPGVSKLQAEADLARVAQQLEQEFGGANHGHGVTAVPLHEAVTGDSYLALVTLFGAVGFVLLIACANVANLLLTRATVRQKEMAIRSALGASRWRLVRQSLTESLLLSLIGGGLGLLVAVWVIELSSKITAVNLPRLDQVNVDRRVLFATIGFSLIAGLLTGVGPALRNSEPRLIKWINESGRTSGSKGRRRVSSALVVIEVALAVVLLVGSGLMLKSFVRLIRVDPGFDPHRVLTLDLALPGLRYKEPRQQIAFYEDLMTRLRSLPGVESVGASTQTPLSRGDNWSGFAIEGRPVPEGQLQQAATRAVSNDYFQTLRIPLRKGRFFTNADARIALPLIRWFPQQPYPEHFNESQPTPAVIINETMARLYWPNQDPLGQRIKIIESPWMTVVGVVGDVHHTSLAVPPNPEIYLSHLQEPQGALALMIRSNGDPLQLASAAREQVKSIDKDQPLTITTMDQIFAVSVGEQRFNTLLLGAFAGLALVLAMIGVFGVINYSVAQRTHEIGIRIALGAQRGNIFTLVVGQGLVLAVIGIALGSIAAFGLTRLIRTLLFGVSPTDAVTFVLVWIGMTTVALLACYVPARRATKVDPLVALRYE